MDNISKTIHHANIAISEIPRIFKQFFGHQSMRF